MPKAPKTHKPFGDAPTSRASDTRPSAGKRGYGRRWREGIRKHVLLRDLYTCQECGQLLGRKGEAHVDHVVPRSEGGADAMDNLQTLCASCHSTKTRRGD